MSCLVREPLVGCNASRLLDQMKKEGGAGPATKEFYKWGGRIEMAEELTSHVDHHVALTIALVVDGALIDASTNRFALSPFAAALWMQPWLWSMSVGMAFGISTGLHSALAKLQAALSLFVMVAMALLDVTVVRDFFTGIVGTPAR